MSAFRYGCVLSFLALLAPWSEQTTWAGISLPPTPMPVQIVLAGPGPCEGYVLRLGADFLWNAESISPVLYKHPDSQTPVVELVHVTVNPMLSGMNFSEAVMPSSTQHDSQLSAVIGATKNWRDNAGAGIAAATAGIDGRKGSRDLGGGNGTFGDAGSNENGNPGTDENSNPVANEKGDPDGDATVNPGSNDLGNDDLGNDIANENGNPDGAGTGNDSNQNSNAGGNGPAVAAVSAPEPSSFLIWLGAALAGTSGVAYRRSKRRK